MNYSIIFTEISFYPETSILLQIIPIIHMIFQMKPEYDRKGRATASVGSGETIITCRLPTDKDFTCLKSRWVLQETPPVHFFKRDNEEEGYVGPQANKIYSIYVHRPPLPVL